MKTSGLRRVAALAFLLALPFPWSRPATAAILTVTSCADNGSTTLRGQVAAASATDTILIPACTITLTTPVIIAKSLTLAGEGASRSAVSGGGVTKVLVVNAGIVVTISGVTIRDGKATLDFGGGIDNSGTLTLVDTVVTGNAAFSGGGIVNGGALTLLNSAVSGNTSDSVAAGINSAGPLTLLNSTVNGNTAGGSAGGIASVTVTLVNSTVSGNTAGGSGAGGISTSGGTLLNSTVSGNTATSGSGGGLSTGGGAGVALKNTIVAHNTAPTGGDCHGPISSQGHNLDSDGSCGLAGSGDLSGTDPILGPLQDNGGSTKTHALLAGSPALDAGDTLGCPPTDQRGTPRPQDGDGNGTPACDIGAYEGSSVNPLTISPPSGVLVTTQGFDLVLTLNAPGRALVGGQATFDGADVTGAVGQCIRPGTLGGGGQTFRCSGLRGGILPPGTHTFSVTVNFNTGPSASATATWQVEANTEP